MFPEHSSTYSYCYYPRLSTLIFSSQHNLLATPTCSTTPHTHGGITHSAPTLNTCNGGEWGGAGQRNKEQHK
jgi:hypothetical protein